MFCTFLVLLVIQNFCELCLQLFSHINIRCAAGTVVGAEVSKLRPKGTIRTMEYLEIYFSLNEAWKVVWFLARVLISCC